MPLGDYTTGTGNISAYTVNANVFGTDTTFLTQLQSGAVIANASNVFVGYVAYITSNTSLIMRENANVAVTTTESYQYATYTPNATAITYNCVGNINTNISTNIIFGNNTAFVANLNYGDRIYVSNTSPYPTDDIFVGHVEYVIDSNTVYLKNRAYANITDQQFYKRPITYQANLGVYGPGTAYAAPNLMYGMEIINNSMYDWVYSGLIPNVSIVHTYHPPIRDSVTGILVHLPATVFTNQNPNFSYDDVYYANLANSTSHLSTILEEYRPNQSGLSSSGRNYTIVDLDTDHHPFGTDVAYVHRSLYNSGQIKKLTLNSTNDAQYINSINAIIPNTNVDNFAKLINANIAKITDTLVDSKEYFSRIGKTEQLKAQGRLNLGQNQNTELRPMPVELKKLVPTGAPIAIPGVLNVKVESDDPSDATWTPVNYYKTSVK